MEIPIEGDVYYQLLGIFHWVIQYSLHEYLHVYTSYQAHGSSGLTIGILISVYDTY